MMGYCGQMICGIPGTYTPPIPPVATYIKEADGVTDLPDADGNPIEEA